LSAEAGTVDELLETASGEAYDVVDAAVIDVDDVLDHGVGPGDHNALMPFCVLSHTADTGIEATANTLGDLIGELCAGMFGLIGSAEPTSAKKWVEVEVVAQGMEELVVDTLSELLYHSEVENLIFCAFRVSTGPKDFAVRVKAGGVLVGAVEPVGPPIKAVTYHDLVVEQRDDAWYCRVYFDV